MSTTTTEASVPEVLVGAFFVSSWGYDQTNVDWYKVVGVTKSGKSVKVQRWTGAVASTSCVTAEESLPGSGPVKGHWVRTPEGMEYDDEAEAPVETKRLRYGGYAGAWFTVASYANAYLWDGNSKYQTAAGFGH